MNFSEFSSVVASLSTPDILAGIRDLTFGGNGKPQPYPYRGTPNPYETQLTHSWDEAGHLSGGKWWYTDTSRWMSVHYEIPLLLSLFYYLFVIVFLQQYMKNRTPPKVLEHILPWWNLSLSVFSLLGTIVEGSYFVMAVLETGFANDICTTPRKGLTPFSFLFCVSKVPELFDTLWLVLKKKEVIFLHWYHHIVTMIYCWDAWVLLVPQGGSFALMNLFVHSIMYFYYFLMSRPFGRTIRVPNVVSVIITLLQITQMIAGLTVLHFCFNNCYSTYLSSDFRVMLNLLYGIVMYFSFFVLFVHFFVGRYILFEKKNK